MYLIFIFNHLLHFPFFTIHYLVHPLQFSLHHDYKSQFFFWEHLITIYSIYHNAALHLLPFFPFITGHLVDVASRASRSSRASPVALSSSFRGHCRAVHLGSCHLHGYP